MLAIFRPQYQYGHIAGNRKNLVAWDLFDTGASPTVRSFTRTVRKVAPPLLYE